MRSGPTSPVVTKRSVSARLTEVRKRFARRRSKGLMANTEGELYRKGTPPDVTSPRAKSQRHGKVTADRWNQ
jgi:hypothetical protein